MSIFKDIEAAAAAELQAIEQKLARGAPGVLREALHLGTLHAQIAQVEERFKQGVATLRDSADGKIAELRKAWGEAVAPEPAEPPAAQ